RRLTPLPVQLGRLLTEEFIDVGITTVSVRAARCREGLDSRGCVPEGAAEAVDDVLQLLLLIGLQEPSALERAELRPDADGLQIVEHGLCVIAGGGVAPQISGIEAFRVSGLREELSGLGGIVTVDRRVAHTNK